MVVEVLISLGRILAPADGALEAELRLAVEQPAAYVEAHPAIRERLASSPDPAGDRDLAWLALADGLIVRRRAAELDWKEGGEDVSRALSQLESFALLSAESKSWLNSSAEEEMAVVDRLRKLAALSRHDEVVVATLDIESDSYVVVLLGKKDYETCMQLAERLGRTLKDIHEHDPNE